MNELPGSGNTCDLSALEPLCNDELLFKQLTENPFELDTFLSELSGDVKVCK